MQILSLYELQISRYDMLLDFPSESWSKNYERFFKGGKMVVYPISPSPPTPMLTKNWKEDQILWVLKSFLPTKTFTEEISLSNYKCIFSKPLLHLEFAKSSAMLAIRAKVVYVSTCQNRANFLLLRANVPTC